MKWSLLVPGFAVLLLAIAGSAAACEGLSPGDELNVGNFICTLGFLVADPNGIYFTTAGHCIKNDETASSPDVGDWGVGVFHFLDPETGSETDGSPGHDFALIKVHPEFYASLNPKMCGWDGPTGIYNDTPGSGMVSLYGHSLVFGDAGDFGAPTYRREGVLTSNGEDAFRFIAPSLMGDSGSAVLHEDGRALGVLTHLTLGTGGTQGGTTLGRGFRLAAEAGFPQLQLVLAGEDPVAVMNALRNAPAPAETAPTPSTTPPSTTPSKGDPAPSRPTPSSNQTADPAPDDSIDPASSPDVEADEAAGKDTPMPSTVLVIGLVVVAAFALHRKRF